MTEQTTFGQYWWEHWQEMSPDARRRLGIALVFYLVMWIAGSYLAATQIAGVADLDSLSRLLAAVAVGPLGVVWAGLELTGFIVENSVKPGLGWMVPGLLHGGLLAALVALSLRPVNPVTLQKRAMERHRRQQGQLEGPEIAELLKLESGLPLVEVQDKKKKAVTVGLDLTRGQGHVLVTAPTQGGKGLHLTAVLAKWPAAAVVIDPKSEQYARTAGLRQHVYGPVYHLPGHQVHLARYYNFLDDDDIMELHDQLLRPGEDFQRIFADKSLPFFKAVGHFARARRLNPLRVLLDAAEDDLVQVLAALDSVPEARPFVRQFTNGRPPEKIDGSDRFLSSAYGTFTTRLFPYQKHIDTICPTTPANVLPPDWVSHKSTLYITYSLVDLQGVGGVVAAILAGLMRDHVTRGRKQRLLVAIDEMAAVKLRRLDTYLATVASAGITMLLYSQSMSQIEGIYGPADAQTIITNCDHQLWYPANDFRTAQHISAQYGTSLRPSRSYSTVDRALRQDNGRLKTVPQRSVNESMVEAPTLSPTEVMALPKDQVIVFTKQERQVRFIGKRLDPRAAFKLLPMSFRPAVPRTGPRRYTDWSVTAVTAGSESRAEASAADEQPGPAGTASTVAPTRAGPGERSDERPLSAGQEPEQEQSSDTGPQGGTRRPANQDDNLLK
jgi:hypothetical protein